MSNFQLSGISGAFAAILLTGCATGPAIVEVKVPAFVPCAKSVQRPEFEVLSLSADASDGEKVVAIARDMIRHFKYEGQLEAALAGCL